MAANVERESSLWRAHPDDALDVDEALVDASRGQLLSADDSEALLRWLEGSGDLSWLEALE